MPGFFICGRTENPPENRETPGYILFGVLPAHAGASGGNT